MSSGHHIDLRARLHSHLVCHLCSVGGHRVGAVGDEPALSVCGAMLSARMPYCGPQFQPHITLSGQQFCCVQPSQSPIPHSCNARCYVPGCGGSEGFGSLNVQLLHYGLGRCDQMECFCSHKEWKISSTYVSMGNMHRELIEHAWVVLHSCTHHLNII